jgi:hypothetical protein
MVFAFSTQPVAPVCQVSSYEFARAAVWGVDGGAFTVTVAVAVAEPTPLVAVIVYVVVAVGEAVFDPAAAKGVIDPIP